MLISRHLFTATPLLGHDAKSHFISASAAKTMRIRGGPPTSSGLCHCGKYHKPDIKLQFCAFPLASLFSLPFFVSRIRRPILLHTQPSVALYFSSRPRHTSTSSVQAHILLPTLGHSQGFTFNLSHTMPQASAATAELSLRVDFQTAPDTRTVRHSLTRIHKTAS